MVLIRRLNISQAQYFRKGPRADLWTRETDTREVLTRRKFSPGCREVLGIKRCFGKGIVLGVKRCLETVSVQTYFPKARQFDDDPSCCLKYHNVPA